MQAFGPRAQSSEEGPVAAESHRRGIAVLRATVRCARAGCVVCSYKVLLAARRPFDRRTLVPNERPQNCPRERRNLAAVAASVATHGTTKSPAAALHPSRKRKAAGRRAAALTGEGGAGEVGGIYQGLRYAVDEQRRRGGSGGLRVLTVGDGDMSFSLAVARLLLKGASQVKSAAGDANGGGGKDVPCEVVATSYESKEDLLRIYPTSRAALAELDALGARTVFRVDACDLRRTLGGSGGGGGGGDGVDGQFHRIIWNFPSIPIVVRNKRVGKKAAPHRGGGSSGGGGAAAAAAGGGDGGGGGVPPSQESQSEKTKKKNFGYDGQMTELPENQRMLQRFSAECVALLAPEGEVHVTHKTKPPFDWWGVADQMTTVASPAPAPRTGGGGGGDAAAGGSGSGAGGGAGHLTLDGGVAFDRACYPPYVNRKALDKKSFPCSDAVTYVFRRPLLFAGGVRSSGDTGGGGGDNGGEAGGRSPLFVCPRTMPSSPAPLEPSRPGAPRNGRLCDAVSRSLQPLDDALLDEVEAHLRCAPRSGNMKKKTAAKKKQKPWHEHDRTE